MGSRCSSTGGRRRVSVRQPGKALQRGAGVQDAAIDPLRLRHKGPACFGQRHAGGAALKQGQIKLLFQTADLVAEGGLGAVQLPGGCGKNSGSGSR